MATASRHSTCGNGRGGGGPGTVLEQRPNSGAPAREWTNANSASAARPPPITTPAYQASRLLVSTFDCSTAFVHQETMNGSSPKRRSGSSISAAIPMAMANPCHVSARQSSEASSSARMTVVPIAASTETRSSCRSTT